MTHEPPANAPIGKNLAKSLVLAQRACGSVEKTKTSGAGGNFSYKYASTEAIIEAANAALGAHGLAVVCSNAGYVRLEAGDVFCTDAKLPREQMQSPLAHEGASGAMLVSYTLIHESGESADFGPFETAVVPDKSRKLDKAQATALTFGLGYFLRGLLLMPRVDEGHEVDARHDEPAPPPPAPTYRPLDEDQLRTVSDAANLDELKLAFGLASKGLSPEDRAKVIAVKDARKAALGVAS